MNTRQRKRMLIFSGLLTVIVFAGFTAWRIASFQPGVRWENRNRIRLGMSYKEVETVFGGPPGHAPATRDWAAQREGKLELGQDGDPTENAQAIWEGDTLEAHLAFDEHWRVVGAHLYRVPPPQESFTEWICRCLDIL